MTEIGLLSKDRDRVKDVGERWKVFLDNFDSPLSPLFDRYLERFQQEHVIPGNIIELACGKYPSSTHLDLDGKQRVLVDIANLHSQLSDQQTEFVQADLNEYQKLHDPEHPYMQAIKKAGGHFGAVIVGSGINYFNWKEALPEVFQDLERGGEVFLFTGIFNSKKDKGDLAELISEEYRPKSTQEVSDFFLQNGFSLVEKTIRSDPTGQEQVFIVAQKM